MSTSSAIAQGRVEFHVAGGWTGVYLDGVLVRVGDSYLADEWLQSFVGVKYVDDDAFMLGQHNSDGVAETLDAVAVYADLRRMRRDRASALRAEAQRLEAEAKDLDTP